MAKRRRKVSLEQIEAAEAAIVDRSKRIDFFMTEYNVELLVKKLDDGVFEVPAYQREFTWDEPRKAKFIESVHMGLPIPFLFFWETTDGNMEIVDGSQRLRTIQEYVKDDLILNRLEEITSLNGTAFSDLSQSRRQKFLNKSIRGIVLNENADPQARFDMFERINTGSKVANPAEVRRGALAGSFQNLIQQLANNPKFIALAPVSVKADKERVPDELVTRFFAYGDGLDDYRDSPNKFIFEYTKSMNDECESNPALIVQYRDRFLRMLDFVEKHFPNGFTKPSNPKSTPRVRFEAISIGVDHALTENPELVDSDGIDVGQWINDDEFKEVTTSDAANVKSKLERRIQFVKDKILG